LTIEERHFERFKREVCEFYRSLGLKRQERFFEVRADVETEELACLDEKFLEELELLAPFGEGNPEPVIGLKDVLVLDARQMGQRGEHLRLTARGRDGVILKLVAFFAPEEWLAVRNGAKIAVLAHLTENVWQGVRSVEGRILEIEGV
jgi:single-stranded-DNA-specific exonuclease